MMNTTQGNDLEALTTEIQIHSQIFKRVKDEIHKKVNSFEHNGAEHKAE